MTEERVNEMYVLARAFCIKKHIWFDDDLIQDLVMYLYEKYEKYDPAKGSFSTFAFMCFKNYLYHNKYKNKPEICINSEDDSFVDKYQDPCEKLILDRISKVIYEDSILVDWINGMSYEDISKKYGKHRTTISRYINRRLGEIRNEYLGG